MPFLKYGFHRMTLHLSNSDSKAETTLFRLSVVVVKAVVIAVVVIIVRGQVAEEEASEQMRFKKLAMPGHTGGCSGTKRI